MSSLTALAFAKCDMAYRHGHLLLLACLIAILTACHSVRTQRDGGVQVSTRDMSRIPSMHREEAGVSEADGRMHNISAATDEITPAAMPAQLHGVWHMGEKPCGVPHPDSDGTLMITADGWQGYEHRGMPRKVEAKGDHRWVVNGEEVYLGSQRDEVEKVFVMKGGALVISEPGYTETYQRCSIGK